MKGVLFSLLVPLLLKAAEVPMTSDYQKAKELSIAYQRPLVLLFVGSDWNKKSEKLLNYVLTSPEFANEVKKDLIFVKLDFPEINTQNTQEICLNHSLKEIFNVGDFPTLILLNPDQKEVTRLGFLTLENQQFAQHLKEMFIDYENLNVALEEKQEHLKPKELEALYVKARDLGQNEMMTKILTLSAESENSLFLMMENYTHLVSSGEKATELRKKLIEKDPHNRKGIRRRIAMLDYQMQDNSITVLTDYIKEFGEQDSKHLWHVHLILSEHFYNEEKFHEALQHAKDSYQSAPVIQKGKISQFINQIKKTSMT